MVRLGFSAFVTMLPCYDDCQLLIRLLFCDDRVSCWHTKKLSVIMPMVFVTQFHFLLGRLNAAGMNRSREALTRNNSR